jgi:hypothetical protein
MGRYAERQEPAAQRDVYPFQPLVSRLGGQPSLEPGVEQGAEERGPELTLAGERTEHRRDL